MFNWRWCNYEWVHFNKHSLLKNSRECFLSTLSLPFKNFPGDVPTQITLIQPSAKAAGCKIKITFTETSPWKLLNWTLGAEAGEILSGLTVFIWVSHRIKRDKKYTCRIDLDWIRTKDPQLYF